MTYALAGNLGAVDVMSHDAYSAPNGLKYIMALDSAGNINQYNVTAGTNSVLGVAEPGSRFSSTEAFAKFFMAFFDATESANFSKSPFVGTDIPRYINALGQLNRVTVDGPGGGMTVGKTLVATMTVSSMTRLSNIVTTVLTAPPTVKVGWFANPIDSIGTPGLTPGGVTIGPLQSLNQTQELGGISSPLKQSTGVNSETPGNVLTVFYNRSDLPGAPDSDLVNAFASGPISIVLTNLEQYGYVSGTYPCIAANTTPVQPSDPGFSHHWYYFSVTVGGAAQYIAPAFNVPENTNATYQRSEPTSNAGNMLFQLLGGVGPTTIVGDGLGNIHVTTTSAITDLPVGAWLFLNINPPTPSTITLFEVSAGTITITVPDTNWTVGTTLLINGFLGGQSPPQPVYLNGAEVLITGASGDTYTFNWSGGTSAGTVISEGGTAVPTNSFYPTGWIQVTQVISTKQFVYFAVNNTQKTSITGTLYDYFGALNTQLSLTPPLPGQAALPNSSAENIAQGFQVLSISGNTITWYQPGPDDTYTGTNTINLVPQTAVTPGPRSAFLFFISQDGAASPGGPPVQFSTNGGSYYPTFETLPLGPPGTVARGLGITPAYGADYFTLPAELQLTAFGPVVTPGTIILDNTTTSIVLDWSDVALVNLPVSGAGALGSDYGDLTSTITLPPCLGVIAYDQTLAWFGEINNIKNLLNMSMQGGAPAIGGSVPSGLPSGWSDGTTYNGITPDGSGTLALASDGSGWVYDMGTAIINPLGHKDTTGYPFQFLLTGNAYDSSWGVTDNLMPAYGIFTFIFGTGSSLSNVGPWPAGGITVNWLGVYNPSPTITGTTVIPYAQCVAGGTGYLPIPAGSYHYEIVAIASPTYYVGARLNIYGTGPGNSMISQSAYQDVWGTPILVPNTSYILRARVQLVSGTPGGQLNFVLYSPTAGVLASCHILSSALPVTLSWIDLPMSAAMPASIPSDAVFYVTMSGNGAVGVVAVADLLLVNANQPVLQNQVRFSYPDNEFGYDNQNGYVLGLATSDAIVSAFVQRQFMYLNTENDLFITQSAGSQPPSEWPVSLSAEDCGGSGPNGVTSLQDLAWWYGRQGFMVFNGTEPKKISQEIQPDFDATNWNALVNTAVAHDAVQRVLYCSFPTGSAVNPSTLMTMNHRMADPAVNTMDPVHISMYTGKMIATDLARKWSPIRLPLNSVKPVWINESGTVQRVMTFGSGGGLDYGEVYYQDFVNYPPTNPAASAWNSVDDDFGQISSYYFTYFFFAHDIEQNAMLALYRKLFAYMSVHAIGSGKLAMTPYVDSMATAWTAFPSITLTLADPGIDYDFPINVLGNRMAVKFANTTGAFQLTHMIVSARRDLVFPVRGAF